MLGWRRVEMFTVMLALTLLNAARSLADGTIYGCVNPTTHKVRLIKTSPPKCRATEMSLSWNQVGPQGPPGPPGPVGPAGSSLRIMDANGNAVGTVASAGQFNASIFRRGGNDLFFIFVDGNGFANLRQESEPSFEARVFFYTAPDCSGTRYMFPTDTAPGFTPWPGVLQLVGAPNGTGYFARSTAGVTQQYYRIDIVAGNDASSIQANCTQSCPPTGTTADTPGMVVGTIGPCTSGSSLECGNCCRPLANCENGMLVGISGTLSPAHAVTPADVGLAPPFSLQP